jgi:hypothetical protein
LAAVSCCSQRQRSSKCLIERIAPELSAAFKALILSPQI